MFKDIKIALETRLSTLSGSTPIAYENVRYKPVLGTMYIRPTLLYASSTLLDLNNVQENPGIFQVDVLYPSNVGMINLLTKMDDIEDHFKGQVLTSGAVKVYISSISANRFVQSDGWIVGTVQINFKSYN